MSRTLALTVVGCTGSLPGPAAPASCYLVEAGDGERTWRVLLDLGSGAFGALQRHLDDAAIDALDAVALTHLHPDHCLDVTALAVHRVHHPRRTSEGARPLPRLPLLGPTGTAERLARAHGVLAPDPLDDVLDVREHTEGVAHEVGPLRITPFLLNHVVPNFGLRVALTGPDGGEEAVIAYTGDTDSTPALTPLLTGADLALLECAYVDGRDERRGVHLTGSRAARAAVDAGGVDRLVLTHLPPWNDPEVCRDQAAAVWPGAVEVAEPGVRYRVR